MSKKKVKEPKYLNSKLNTQLLNYRVFYFSAIQKILYSLLIFVLGGIVGLVFYMNLFMKDGEPTTATHISNLIVFVLFGVLGIKFFLPIRKKTLFDKQSSRLTKEFREMLSSLSTSFESGDNIYGAFKNAYNEMSVQFGDDSMIVKELYVIVNGVDNGFTIDELLEDFAARSNNDDIVSFVNVFNTCQRTGGDMRAVIRNTYDLIGDKITITEEINTKLASNKMQQSVMSVMPIVIIAFLRFTSSNFAENFASPAGVMIMTVAGGIFIGAFMYGRKIIDVKG
jgi:tight adherence protein B